MHPHPPSLINQQYRARIFGRSRSTNKIFRDYNVIYGTVSQQRTNLLPQIMTKLKEVESMVVLPPPSLVSELQMYFLRRNLSKESLHMILQREKNSANPQHIKSDKELNEKWGTHKHEYTDTSTYCNAQKEKLSSIMKKCIKREKDEEKNEETQRREHDRKRTFVYDLPQIMKKKGITMI